MSEVPSRQTLEGSPARVISFLNALSRNERIYAIMFAHGYNQAEHNHGFSLVQLAVGMPASTTPLQHAAARKAIAELDQWDEPHFRMARGAFGRLHKKQGDFVFEGGLSAGQGFEAVVAVTTFLDRLDALESSPERTATRDADAAALATLARRGIDAAERTRLKALVADAQILPNLPPSEAQAKAQQRKDRRDKALLDLYNWHKDWSNTAHAFVRRRDHLIALGLAVRRTQ